MEENFRKNLRIIRKKLGLTQSKFAEPLGIKGSTISSMERGITNPSNSVLDLIEIKYKVNRKWLLTGEGELFPGGKTDAPIYKKVGDDDPAHVFVPGAKHALQGGRPSETSQEDWHMLGDPRLAPAITVAFVDYASDQSGQHARDIFPQLKEEYIDSGQLVYVLQPWSSGEGVPIR